ncbi:MAG: GH36-type glycosyl hydrolase domain-containing protein, partial [Candidatus Binatia bacterium]
WVVRALAELGRRDRAARLLAMLSPVRHAASAEAVATYQVEPYVVAADVYGTSPHVGRGGWTWYTGSAAWMYRVALESVLGFTVEAGEQLRLAPRVPDEWPRFRIRYRLPDGRTRYEILVENPDGRAETVREVRIDGAPGSLRDGAAIVPLVRDGGEHRVVLCLGTSQHN